MILTQGSIYRAQLKLPFYATQAMARAKLAAAGFTTIQMYSVNDNLFVQATWSGATQEVTDLPSQLSNITLVSPPAA